MALIQYSALVNSMSGKLNGSVASFNKGGSYLRNKGIVSNPNTVAQASVRAEFSMISQSWRGLTEAQRTGWREMALNVPYQNVFGETKNLSGFGLFVQRNQNLSTIGVALIVGAPTDEAPPTAGIGQPELQTGGISTVVVTSPGLGTWVPVLFMTPKLSDGVLNFENKLRLATPFTTVTPSSPFTYSTPYWGDKYGNAGTGTAIGTGVCLINSATGQKTTLFLNRIVSA